MKNRAKNAAKIKLLKFIFLYMSTPDAAVNSIMREVKRKFPIAEIILSLLYHGFTAWWHQVNEQLSRLNHYNYMNMMQNTLK